MTTETPFTLGNLLGTVSNGQAVTLCVDLGGEDREIRVEGTAGALYEGMPEEFLARTYDMIEVAYDFDGSPYLSIDC